MTTEHKHTLRLYNTLTRKKDDFTPIDPANVRMYVCGPTVYDFAHIGNARPVIVFDVLFRLLRHIYGEAHVTYARNITDVDDKINARALRDHPGLALKDAIRLVTERTNSQFQTDVKALGCLDPTHQPRATEHMTDMVDIIGRLLANGCAYIAHGNEGREVLFDISRMKNYGALSNRKLDEQREGARVAVEAHKRSPGDFVLWKESGADEPGWDAEFPSDKDTVTIFGRPGWHIECSAMSMAKLLRPYGGGLTCDDPQKNTFDIHGGGIDLVFPHHENEIAQSCCAFGTDVMANVWMHNGFVQVEGRKMSKSDGNFITIDDLLNTTKFGGRSWIGPILRLAMLKTHYRQPTDWTLNSLEEAQTEFRSFAELAPNFAAQPIVDADFVACLFDDMNTPDALTRLRQLRDEAAKGNVSSGRAMLGSLRLIGLFDYPYHLKFQVSGPYGSSESYVSTAIKQLTGDYPVSLLASHAKKKFGDNDKFLNILDNFVMSTVVNYLIGCDLKKLSGLNTLRNAARAAKNWPESDRIRAELDAMGIALKDGKDEAGNPVSTWEVKR